MSNKSIFVTILLNEKDFLSVYPLVQIQEGECLGISAGKVRFSETFDDTYGVPGPAEHEGLWLDYSEVTGALNLMGVARLGGNSKAGLWWELTEERIGRNTNIAWTVSVRALRSIKPFEEIIKATA